MYCTKCGRFTEELTCPKCNVPIDERTREIPWKDRPSTFLCFVALAFHVIALPILLLIHPKTPKIRAAIQCAKSSLIYYGIAASSILIGTYLGDSTIGWVTWVGLGLYIIFGLMALFSPLFIVFTITRQKKFAMGINPDKKSKK